MKTKHGPRQVKITSPLRTPQAKSRTVLKPIAIKAPEESRLTKMPKGRIGPGIKVL
ncbi:MAG TPA: hypothetical protein VIX17_00730 [Pyrinomonadaceae bacterium]|jgi:hypothetical protein